MVGPGPVACGRWVQRNAGYGSPLRPRAAWGDEGGPGGRPGSREKLERSAGRAIPFGSLAPSCVRRRLYAGLTALTAGQAGWGQDGGASCAVRTSERTRGRPRAPGPPEHGGRRRSR
ncbi:unnamed protein product [Rangifer tarandus platyrhynchus]|uniref:Uncharacterized protein n=1 Tax=Rangifer tarandus platyrhynchus TaxID=3082113 RepID=A0ABN8YVP2_RANTA|nr:unnamed protein product [Rangifer tarandus platyrhynchus]